MATRVKEELHDEDPEEGPPPSRITSLIGDSAETLSGLPPIDLDSDMEEPDEDDDDDVIVREIDVFLSPELSNKLHLMQFPLQRQPFSQNALDQPDRPHAARIKPQHCMIELEYMTNTEAHQDYNGQFYLSKRIFSSQTIPVSTHMALGKMVSDGSAAAGLHLVPLTRITQMRPSFHHVNEATMNLSSSADDLEALQSSSDGPARRPLPFQKKESERAALARKSSYAFKKVSEDSEVWIPLEVHGEDSPRLEEVMAKVRCSAPNQNLMQGTGGLNDGSVGVATADQVASNQNVMQGVSSSASPLSFYVQSLNYLPQSYADSKLELVLDETGTQPDLVVTTVTKMVELMHQGWPMPYSILRAQFDRNIYSDDVLLQALSSCAYFLRGNFILQSRLLPLPLAVGQARTFILLMLQSVGVVHRARLEYAYEGDDQVTPEVLLMLLQQVATLTSEGWKAKLDDDVNFEINFPQAAPIHLAFWKKQVRRFSGMVERYRLVPRSGDPPPRG